MHRSQPSNTACVIAFPAPGSMIPLQYGHSTYRSRPDELFLGQHVVERGMPGKDGWIEMIGPTHVIVAMRPRNRFDARRRRAIAARDLVILS